MVLSILTQKTMQAVRALRPPRIVQGVGGTSSGHLVPNTVDDDGCGGRRLDFDAITRETDMVGLRSNAEGS
jgi:hypothetical protein